MKKSGCFFTGIVSLTIIIGILFYLGKKYSPEIWEFGKEKLLTAVEKDFKKEIKSVEENKYKDSLIVLVNSQLERMKKLSFDDMDNDSLKFFENVEEIIKDKKIDRDEISQITELYKKYER